jgi:histidyl-tRNA synthetase
MRFQRPRGTQDHIGPESAARERLRAKFRELCALYGYAKIETPVFEATALFERSVGQETDIVSKEMYTFDDGGGRMVSLRPEGTATAVRAYLENGLQGRGAVTKLAYSGTFYRREAPQRGRYREFEQVGVECLGAQGPEADVEVIALLMRFLREALRGVQDVAGSRDVTLRLGSLGDDACRPQYLRTLRDALAPHTDEICKDCRKRLETNPMRLFDCKKNGCRAILADAPKMLDHLCDACGVHWNTLRRGLDRLGIAYEVDPGLARGLDYYTRTVFEVTSPGLGAQDAVGGGGRYDGLVELLGGPPTPATGFASGVDRILLAAEAEGAALAGVQEPLVYVAALDVAGRERMSELLERLRDMGLAAVGDLAGRSLKAQMRAANRESAQFAVILGGEELERGHCVVRTMADGMQREAALESVVQEIAAEHRRQPEPAVELASETDG